MQRPWGRNRLTSAQRQAGQHSGKSWRVHWVTCSSQTAISQLLRVKQFPAFSVSFSIWKTIGEGEWFSRDLSDFGNLQTEGWVTVSFSLAGLIFNGCSFGLQTRPACYDFLTSQECFVWRLSPGKRLCAVDGRPV